MGGVGEVYSGPDVRECGQQSGAIGTSYVYVLERTDTDGADPRADVGTMSALWKEQGIEVEPFQSGGEDPMLGVRGTSGPLLLIGFDAYPGRYPIIGVSECADGDPDGPQD